MANNTLINGNEYGFSSIKAHLLSRTVEGFSAISYWDKTEKVNHKGRGGKTVSRGRGNDDCGATITLAMKEVEAIQNALPRGMRLQDIAAFNIDIAYDMEIPGEPIVRHRLVGCEFTGQKREVKLGDTGIEIELELVVGEIIWAA